MAIKKELTLLLCSVAITVVVAVGLLRWLAPQLMGVPIDLQMVQVAEETPPFFDNVFRTEDFSSGSYLISDPFIRRAKPLFPNTHFMGPNDLLGFRNHQIPNVADIVTIGDSQTYGNNSSLEANWPSQMAQALGKHAGLYSMATGGWGAIEYLEILSKAVYFRPRIVVVAFYTGNDALDSFKMAYANDRWAALRPDPSLQSSDVPAVTFPALKSEWWPVTFDDGVTTVFTPKLRFEANQQHVAVQAGYGVMANAARKMVEIASANNIKIVFTIIPTKEFVYAEKITRSDIDPPQDYDTLLTAEGKNLRWLAGELNGISGGLYIDVVEPLQQAALQSVALYPLVENGHPVDAGYKVIGQTIAATVDKNLPTPLDGAVAVSVGEQGYNVYLVREATVWFFPSSDLFEGNGWVFSDASIVTERDLATFSSAGWVNEINPEKFGPSR